MNSYINNEVGGQLSLGLKIQNLVEQNIQLRKNINGHTEDSVVQEEWGKLENAIKQMEEMYTKPRELVSAVISRSPGNRGISEEKVGHIRQMKSTGHSLQQITKTLNVSAPTVRKYLNVH